MNRDCWYYLLDQFFTIQERHRQLKLVSKLFYSIVCQQTLEHFKHLEGRLVFQETVRQYEIFRNYFLDIDIKDNQRGWILSPKDIIENDRLISSNLIFYGDGYKIIIYFEFNHRVINSVCKRDFSFHLKTKGKTELLHATIRVDLVKTKHLYDTFTFGSRAWIFFLCENECLEYLAEVRDREYIMILLTIGL